MALRNLSPGTKQAGLTIVELMVSMVLGLLVVMAATALLLSAKSGYTAQDEGTRIQETGRYALESIARAVHQAAYENWDKDEAPILATAGLSANLAGLDARSLKEKTFGITSPLTTSVNGSDVLAVRFFGAGIGVDGDRTVFNCAGFGVPAPASHDTADADRGWSIFYLAESSGSGEPELRCKYQGKSGWESDAIASGVESFQVLYGVDTDDDGLPNKFVNAATVDALDDALDLVGGTAAAKAIDKNRKTHWKKVVVIKVALLVHGAKGTRMDAMDKQYDLFGTDYGDKAGTTDSGTRIKEADLPIATRNRPRKIFTLTIQLRNKLSGSQV